MGFNPGSTLGASDLRISVVAVNTNLAAVAGSATALLFWYLMFGKPDITMACNGMLAGLVAITAPCAFVSPNSAVIIGILAGILVCVGVLFNERILKVDDPCGAISVHGYCGWLGAVSVGIFADGTYGCGLERCRRNDLPRQGGPGRDRPASRGRNPVLYAARGSHAHMSICIRAYLRGLQNRERYPSDTRF